jgi:hypothetical protein
MGMSMIHTILSDAVALFLTAMSRGLNHIVENTIFQQK